MIEEAGLRSLGHGTTTEGLVQTIQRLETSVPLVIMTLQSLVQHGLENFPRDLKEQRSKGDYSDLPLSIRDLVSLC